MAVRRRGEPSDLDELSVPGNVAPDVIAQGVKVTMSADGVASFWPVSFDRLQPDVAELARDVLDLVNARRHLAKQIDELVPELRLSGLSWAQIGFLVGLTDEGARKRWGSDV